MAIGSPPPADDDSIRLDDDEPNQVQGPTNTDVSQVGAKASVGPAVEPADDDIIFMDDEPDAPAVEPQVPSVLPVEHKPAPTRAPTPKSPKGISRIMRNKAARLLVWGTLVGGAMGGAIYGANKIPAINGSSNVPAQTQPTPAPTPTPTPAEVPAKAPAKPAPAEAPAGTVIVPKSIDEAIKNGQIMITAEGKRKPVSGWKWTHLNVSGFPEDSMERFSITKK
ncbi:MAG: hypothetical protein Q8P62_03775 [Candidatus Peregrinibacteria bacterium]|nr:hypothetical protein [Candidatus Peregrinibacteria bacterium]